MKKICLALVVLLIAVAVPAVSATTESIVYDNRYEYDPINMPYETSTGAGLPDQFYISNTGFKSIETLNTVFWRPHADAKNFLLYDDTINTATYPINLRNSVQSGVIVGTGTFTYYKGVSTAQSHVRVDIDTYNPELRTSQMLVVDFKDNPINLKAVYGSSNYLQSAITNSVHGYSSKVLSGTTITEYVSNFVNEFTLSEYNTTTYKISIKRDNLNEYYSQIVIYGNDGNIISDTIGLIDENIIVLKTLEPYTIQVYSTNYQKSYITYIGDGEPWIPPGEEPTGEATPITIYVKNSQTGALIANSNIVIDALVNGEYYPVVNRTEPSGIFSITLQPTGGGQPNPDGYRLIATADGYNNPMPEINFTVDDYKLSIYCLLDPIAGGPVNENKTFIDFFVRDMSSNPISGATVKFGKYTLITNSAGYTVFEVDKNNNYSWTVSKSGYGPLTGNAVIGNDPRHTINTVLAPIVTPTTTTPIPTSPSISPTPTMTAPTGEPVSNWLEWFAAHFGMILGGGAEIGKIFMWLCFAVPVGVYVGKEAKAGAAGFMAGAGIVTLFFTLIGWVPIWLLVLLALIIGLLYAKVFNSQDSGGGR